MRSGILHIELVLSVDAARINFDQEWLSDAQPIMSGQSKYDENR
jgi:hypothetical protein